MQVFTAKQKSDSGKFKIKQTQGIGPLAGPGYNEVYDYLYIITLSTIFCSKNVECKRQILFLLFLETYDLCITWLF